MPLHFCHPNTPHRKLRVPEWFVSSLMMDRALDAVVRRAKTLDRKHDIPYLAGYSKDGKTIYIDRHMPSSFRYEGRDINTDRYLILHEEVEKTLIERSTCTICMPIRSPLAPSRPRCVPPASDGAITTASCRNTSSAPATSG